jgi:hypothetical protein
MLSTSQLRVAYGPACKDNSHNFLPAMNALDAAFKKWKYPVRSGSGCYNCRMITGGDDYSLHAYPDFQAKVFWNGYRIGALALAIDVNPSANPYGPRLITDMPRGMIDDIYKIRTKNGKQVFRWGGYYTTNKDAMHFEIVCSKADLATGIDPKTIPGAVTTPVPQPEEEEEDMIPIYVYFKDNRVPGKNYTTLADSTEVPIASGAKCYAITNGTWQNASSLAIGKYISGGKAVVVGSGADPIEIIDPDGKVNGWFMGAHLVDGPLAGIKK